MSGELIWRYVDFSKFVSMLTTNRLWFAKAALFSDDPWEGFGRARTLQAEEDDSLPKVIRRERPDGTSTMCSVPQMISQWSQGAGAYVENAAEHLYINSWFLGAAESMALWEIYGSQGRGIALRSTTELYRQAAQFTLPSEQYAFGVVDYHDSLEDEPAVLRDFTETISFPGSGLWPKLLELALHKRACYQHEHEWRAVIYQDLRPELRGLVEPFDLSQLISEIVVGPRAEEFVVEAVTAITTKFLPRVPVTQSTLLQRPVRKVQGGSS